MDISSAIQTYLVVHGISTVGAIIVFLIRNEHRITKLETSHQALKESHNALTDHGTIRHDFGDNKL